MSKQAMEMALDECRDNILNGRGPLEAVLDNDQTNAVLSVFDEMIDSIKEAIKQQGEPVAWASVVGPYAHIVWGGKPDDNIHTIPLYTYTSAPQQGDRYEEGKADGWAACESCHGIDPEVGLREPVVWQWRKKGEPWSLDRTFDSQVFATTDDTEVRALYAIGKGE